MTHLSNLDNLHLTERGLEVRPGYLSTTDEARQDGAVPGGQNNGGLARENDLVVELGGEWTVGLTPEEWTALAASLAAHHHLQVVLLR